MCKWRMNELTIAFFLGICIYAAYKFHTRGRRTRAWPYVTARDEGELKFPIQAVNGPQEDIHRIREYYFYITKGTYCLN
jgi:hypothetical protein